MWPKSFIQFDFSPQSELSLDKLVAAIINTIPESVVVAENWYSERWDEEQETLKKMQREPGFDRLVHQMHESIKNAEREHGPAKSIRIPLKDGTTVSGRISLNYSLLHSDATIDSRAVEPLVSAIRALGILKEFSICNV